MAHESIRKSLSRLETSQSTPPFFPTSFSTAPHFVGELPQIVQNARKSILRKRVYSFKHSGNSRGQHRGPEKVCVFWRSGVKTGVFARLWCQGMKKVKAFRFEEWNPIRP